jgi:hypothetical protein
METKEKRPRLATLNTDTKIQKKSRVSVKLVQQAATERWIKPLALFHTIKTTFVNSVIFDYRKRMKELAERFGIARKTLYSYLNILHYNGLMVNFPGNPHNLHLKSIKSIKQSLGDQKKCNITISQDDKIWEISCRLYSKLIESHFKKMVFTKALKEFGRRDLHKMIAGETAAAPFSLSIRNTAKLLKVNEKTAKKVLKTLKDLNILEIYPQKPVKISDGKLLIKLLEDMPGYRFTGRTGTYQQFGNKIELIEYPIKVPKITPKIYANYYKSIQCKKYHNYKMIV